MSSQSLIDTVQAMPKEAWGLFGAVIGAVIGSVGALAGAWLQNRYANNRHVRELVHDARERKEERDAGLKRDVYLEAVSDITEGLSALRDFWRLDVPVAQTGERLRAAAVRGPRLFAVASLDVLTVLEEIDRLKVEAVRDIEPVHISYHESLRRLQTLEAEFQTAVAAFHGQSEAFEFGKVAAQIGTMVVAERSKLHELEATFHKVGIDKLRSIERARWKAMLAIRRDLRLPIDETAVLRLAAESEARQFKFADEFLAKQQREMREIREDAISRASEAGIVIPGDE